MQIISRAHFGGGIHHWIIACGDVWYVFGGVICFDMFLEGWYVAAAASATFKSWRPVHSSAWRGVAHLNHGEMQPRNTFEEKHLIDIFDKHSWEKLLRNVAEKETWRNTVEKYSWGWRGGAHLNHGYERINVAAAAPCILFFMEMHWFGRATFFPWKCSHFDIQYSNCSIVI